MTISWRQQQNNQPQNPKHDLTTFRPRRLHHCHGNPLRTHGPGQLRKLRLQEREPLPIPFTFTQEVRDSNGFCHSRVGGPGMTATARERRPSGALPRSFYFYSWLSAGEEPPNLLLIPSPSRLSRSYPRILRRSHPPARSVLGVMFPASARPPWSIPSRS